MVNNNIGKKARALLAVSLAAVFSSGGLRADDTEIYQSSFSAEDTGRPKVLIIFDNSGSMRTDVTQQAAAYDPSGSYVSRYNDDRIYWSTNSNPPGTGTSQYFSASKNRCESSFGPLATVGFFQGKARRWRKTDSVFYAANDWIYSAGWESLSTGDRNPIHVDCETDVLNGEDGNGTEPDGFPFMPPIVHTRNGTDYHNPDLELSGTAATTNVAWGNEGYTFYTAHYLDYLADPSTNVTRQRIDIAQEVVTGLIAGNPGIDFGLAVFNYNDNADRSGGRIIKRILDSDVAAVRNAHRVDTIATINGLAPQTWTPLCETTYEAYRYIAGLSVHYGDDRRAGFDGPDRDLLAESPVGTYASPSTSCAYTYVILMTDGEPTYDTNANAAIRALTGNSCDDYDDGNGGTSENCLPQLAEYMATTDLDGDTTNGDQFGITYTIGFTTEQDLLRDTAALGNGAYYTAESASELAAAFQGAILQILATDATFTSPAVAVDSFTRTQSRNDVFLSMFLPSANVDWRGNIKKLRFATIDDQPTLVDKNGAPALNASGEFDPDASTYWSNGDGGDVVLGGVGALLAARDPATRVIKTNTGVAGALEDFGNATIDRDAYGLGSDADLFALFGLNDQAQLDALLNWARGYQVEAGGALAGTRDWILADMLHSKPLVINYGALGGATIADPDLRIVAGTNGGFVHMFNNANGAEDWAFFPKELAPILKQRADNARSPDHVYGVDGSPVLYSRDLNRDGTINSADGDTAYIYVGLRRGGRALYALDVSTPGTPSFLWKIDNGTAGFGELGQTWSNPVVTRVPGYVDGSGYPKPVLVFGAGYDTNKDDTGVITPDSMGRGLYIVDAATGALVWSVTPADDALNNKQELGLAHSVAASPTLLDSNGDGLTDRIYFVDTGGNVWRVDMPGVAAPTVAQDEWHISKLAAMNGGTEATDRRFFNAVDLVRTSYAGTLFDAVLIGSGDRTNPNSIDVDDQFYMIRDRQIGPYFTEFVPGDCDADPDTIDDNRCALPFGTADLYDVTPNLIQDGTDEQQATAHADLAQADGWRLDLTASGEKSLSSSVTIQGKVYIGTFSPELNAEDLCAPSQGIGRLYIVNLADATRTDVTPPGEIYVLLPPGPPDTPSVHVSGAPDGDGEIRLLLPRRIVDTGATLADPYGSYWYREEY